MNQDELKKKAVELVERFRPFSDRGMADTDYVEIRSATECAILAQQMVIDSRKQSIKHISKSQRVWETMNNELTEAQSLLTILKEML